MIIKGKDTVFDVKTDKTSEKLSFHTNFLNKQRLR